MSFPIVKTISRRSLTLLEVLLAAVLVTTIFACVFRTWLQLDTMGTRHHSAWLARAEHSMKRLWLQDHLGSLVKRAEKPVLQWDGQTLQVTCIHGPHLNPRLAGPVELQLSLEDGQLFVTLRSDALLWKHGRVEERRPIFSHVNRIEFRAFGASRSGDIPHWHEERQEWHDLPRLMELALFFEHEVMFVPVFVFSGEFND
jgi:hypothetical protein